jgi:protein TonB
MKSAIISLLIVIIAGCATPAATPPIRKHPQVLAMPAPSYPDELKKAGVGGEVVVDFDVGPDGRVHNATIISSPDSRLGAMVLQATSEWRFAPATIDGQPVATHLRVPISFDPNSAK